MPTREQIYAALFGVLQKLNPTTATPAGDGTLASPVTRNFQMFSQVSFQPWLCLLEDSENASYPVYQGPSKRIMSALAIVYAQHNDPNVAGGTILNNLLDAVENAVRPDNVGRDKEQTLGGLVHWVRFSEKTTTYVGNLFTQSITVMQFHILATT